MADSLNQYYLKIKVFDSLNSEVYSSACPRSLLDRFTFNLQVMPNWPEKHYFMVFDQNNKIRYDSRLADKLMG